MMAHKEDGKFCSWDFKEVAMSEVSRQEFITLQERVEKNCGKVDLVLENHIPHINAALARIDGSISTVKWMVGIGLTVIGLALTAVAIIVAIYT